MKPRTELRATIAVCAVGVLYFGWKAWIAAPDDRALYMGLVIVGVIVGRHAIRDVQRKIEEAEKAEQSDDRTLDP